MGPNLAQQNQPGLIITPSANGFNVSGTLDEHVDFSALMSADPELRLNLSGVKRINSIGLRNFMMFLKSWGKGEYAFIDCPVEFVDQINLVPSILKMGGSGWVESCQTPVVCRSCGKDAEILVAMNPRPNRAPPAIRQACSVCGGALELATEGYFNFLQFLR
jgi:hypothetical protein